MSKLILVITILALILQSIIELVPLSHVPHTHILIGNVTPEQLRAHEEAEAQEVAELANPPAPALPPSPLTRTATGGLIISVVPIHSGIVSVLHLDIALQLMFLFVVPLITCLLSRYRVALQTRVLAVLDPPPRSFPAFA